VSGQGPEGRYRGIGPPVLENFNDDQENDQCEQNLFSRGPCSSQIPAMGKLLALGLPRIGNSCVGPAGVESHHNST